MKFILYTFSFFTYISGFAQGNTPRWNTPDFQNKILQEVEQEVKIFRLNNAQDFKEPIQFEFAVDTFKAERFMKKWVELDYSNAGILEVTYVTSKMYDTLLNKYYSKLLHVLNDADKKALINAQKAWISFRDNELKLLRTISKPEYSGGGTIQQLAEAASYVDIIKKRTMMLFEHYSRAIQAY